ncbi:MAG: HAMP domain-containing protein [Acidobacteria bacterium]|nr:HAMP domain-containing protein [Acidobacteriota bacterium]
MSEPVWYRSLYWRIALGFVGVLAAVLLVQAIVFLWMTGRMADLFPNRTPAQLAAALAADVSGLLSERPDADLDRFINERYSGSSRGFVVVLADGRTVVNHRVPPPPMLARQARGRIFEGMQGGRRDRGERSGWREFGRGSSGPAGVPPPSGEFAPVVVNGTVTGIAAVPLEPPPLWMAARDLGPLLGAVAAVLLTAGTAVAALVIFRPARRRLRHLQDAARAIGAGELGVRAPVAGGDEVAALAGVFNEMASELEQRTTALERSDRTRRQLLADVSHELMTPLAAVRGYVETLQMKEVSLDAETQSRYLQIISEEAERLEHIIGDLLDLARLEGGGGTWRIEPVAIPQLFDRIRRRHEQVLADRGIALLTTIEPEAMTLSGDPNRLEQALQNLVANAIRHTPDGGTIAVRAQADPKGTRLSVEDTGQGIPTEHLDRVFDRFYKVDQSRTGTDIPSGSGLGLSIVRAIVTRHGGQITASNRPEGGARVEIVLPQSTAV